MTAPRALVAAAAILDDLRHPTRLLAARRSAPKTLAGRWEFPGGKVEPGEADHDAVHRELHEELGIRIHLGEQIAGPAGADWPILHGHRMRVWFAQIVTGDPAPLADHDDLRWLPLGELRTVAWLDPDLPIVRAIQSRLGVVGAGETAPNRFATE
ncbi:(deoxy)nucleoside triphosphate pyrophosphohydrolase [Pseudactinotalea sp. Z1748]|uniref:(deoxy)nucleoside triphosphate pyrophosphohydrolase n=1 Tax=Pseudactinotalea sp. Z1748 TaxID=3413027 RepID=UPI003C7E0108